MTSAQKKFWIPLLICAVCWIATLFFYGRPLAFLTGAASIAGGVLFLMFQWNVIFDWFNKDS